MGEIYEKGAADAIFDRVEADETGELRHLVLDLIETCKRVAELGVPLDELATCCTLAWYMGQSPELKNIFDAMLKGKSPENIDN